MIPVSAQIQAGTTLSTGWQAQWRNAISDPCELLRILGLDDEAARLSASSAQQFPMRVPLAFVRRMVHGDRHDPLLAQVLPIIDEEREISGFDALDPVGDAQARSAQGVLQKYQGRALLLATGACAVHCRYCFRRHFPYSEENASANQWRDAIAKIAADSSVEEVILSGGDPLSLSTAKLRVLTDQLRSIPHLKRLRIHTRLPIVLPARVDQEFLGWLGDLPWPITVVIHANHANEFDVDVDQVINAMRRTGATVLNQAVLLKHVNDSVPTLKALSERSFQAGALPYYLHVLDRVQGAGHFDVPDEAAIELHRELAKQLSGYLVPRLVREIQGETGKTPVA